MLGAHGAWYGPGDDAEVLAKLADPALPLETLIWRLFNEEREVRTLQSVSLSKGCRCNADYIASVIAKFPQEDRAAMAFESLAKRRRTSLLMDLSRPVDLALVQRDMWRDAYHATTLPNRRPRGRGSASMRRIVLAPR